MLNLNHKRLATLDGIDLTGVTTLYCSFNHLKSLPPLPETLEKLWCQYNQLTSLPHLPETLEKFILL